MVSISVYIYAYRQKSFIYPLFITWYIHADVQIYCIYVQYIQYYSIYTVHAIFWQEHLILHIYTCCCCCLFVFIDATNITIFVKDYIVFEDDGFIEINFEINRPPLHTSEFIVEIHTFDGEAESKVVCIAVCCIYIL